MNDILLRKQIIGSLVLINLKLYERALERFGGLTYHPWWYPDNAYSTPSETMEFDFDWNLVRQCVHQRTSQNWTMFQRGWLEFFIELRVWYCVYVVYRQTPRINLMEFYFPYNMLRDAEKANCWKHLWRSLIKFQRFYLCSGIIEFFIWNKDYCLGREGKRKLINLLLIFHEIFFLRNNPYRAC